MGRPESKRFLFLGGLPCLDFVNTGPSGGRGEALVNFPDLLAWLIRSRPISEPQLRQARRRCYCSAETKRAHRKALIFRKRLREMLEHMIAGKGISETAIMDINEFLGQRRGHPELVRRKGRVVQTFRWRFDRPCRLLAPIAESASDLLCNRDLSRVKRCANPSCGLFFYETARNRRRRWCSMKTCGNRMKSAAFRRRQRLTHRPTIS